MNEVNEIATLRYQAETMRKDIASALNRLEYLRQEIKGIDERLTGFDTRMANACVTLDIDNLPIVTINHPKNWKRPDPLEEVDSELVSVAG